MGASSSHIFGPSPILSFPSSILTSSPTTAAPPPQSANPIAGGCPVAHHGYTAPAPHHPSPPTEPPISTISRNVPLSSTDTESQFHAPPDAQNPELPSQGEEVPTGKIPSTGRGNSSDGLNWLNPSPNQLYRALRRNEKPIEPEDAPMVSHVHEHVTEFTWASIMEYENLHMSQCKTSRLSRFYGMDGIYSHKAKILSTLGMAPKPFDRHDWIVDRCGKEIKYIIDYYSYEEVDTKTGEAEVSYFIDARPAPTLGGLYDRTSLAYIKWKGGEKWW